MKKIKDWINKKAGSVTLALSNVEKNALSQTGELMSTDTHKFQRHTQGQVADSLINGEITQEVMDLRWRTYKVLRETEGLTAEIVGYETDGTPIVQTRKSNKDNILLKIKVDEYDQYPLEMVLDNSEIAIDATEHMGSKYLNTHDKPIINLNDKGEVESATHGEINATEFLAITKTEKPIVIERSFFPRFNIEKYTKKLNVRNIDGKQKLLEFYVSKYPDMYDRTSRLFLSEVKKIIMNPDLTNILDMDWIEFITYKTLGVNDFLKYKYENIKYDKTIEFDGFHVIKFKADVVIDGKDIFEEHRQEGLDKKYENKEKK